MKKGVKWLLLKSASLGAGVLLFASPTLGQVRPIRPKPRVQIPGRVLEPVTEIRPIEGQVLQAKAPKVDLQVTSPDIQVLRKAPVKLQRFPVADPQTGTPIAPTTILTLPDGRKVEAGTYYAELNKIESGLNDLGYSLRTMPQQLVLQRSVVNTAALNQQTAQISSIGPRISDTTLKQRFLDAPTIAGGQRVLMSDQLTSQAIQSVRNQNVGKSLDIANNQLRITPQVGAPRTGGLQPRITGRVIKIRPGALGAITGINLKQPKTFHREQPWNWSVGNPSSFQAYLTGKLMADGKAYPVANPSDAELFKSNSEYTLSGEARAGGSILGRNLTLLDAKAQFYAPSNVSKPMNANGRVQVIGITVLNLNQNIPSKWEKSEEISRGLRYGVPFGIPLGPVWLGGEIGASGDAGLRYSVSMNRTGVGGNITPFIRAGVYGEGGASIVIAGAGVGVQMTLLRAELDLYGQARLGWFLKWIFMQNFYVGYKVNMLSGRVYGYVYVYVPDFGIPPWTKKQWEHNFWNWSGFTKEGSLVNFENTIVFEDWDKAGSVLSQ